MVSVEHQVITGIGNEVFIATVIFAAVIIVVAVLLCTFRWPSERHPLLHNLSQETVNNVRNYLRFSNRFDGQAVGSGENGTMDTQHFGPDNQCPVCLNEPRFPVETNCGHLFCAQCIILYWRHGNWGGAVRCPVCRQQVSVLLRCFRDGGDEEERNQILWDINDYNRRFSGEPRPWLDYVWDLPTLLRHLGSEFFSVGGLMYMFRLRIVLCFVAAIMYLVSPLDMIPEAVFGILGLLDDLFVVLLLAIYVTVIYRRFLAGRWQDAT